jgi:hypothetical protein
VQTIEYRIVYAEGGTEIVKVLARTINSGFAKALRVGLQPLGNGRRREIARVEFWAIP